MKTTNSKSTKPTTTVKKTVAKKAAPTKLAAASKPVKAVKAAQVPKTASAKAPEKKKTTVVTETIIETFEITNEQIALRAYFIAEQQHRENRHTHPHQNWLEAERQLTQERAHKAGTTKTRGNATARRK